MGKTSVGFEVSAWLQGADVAHCIIDGDNLSAAYPRPVDDLDGRKLIENNLRALWATYAATGQRRMIYVNTLSVLNVDLIRRAVDDDVDVRAVLLTASDTTVHRRLQTREIGSALAEHVEASHARDAVLQATTESWVTRTPTDDRTITEIAADVVAASGWARPVDEP